ncbi:MAG: hypothetical protein ACOCRX_05215 [Candidatus Woesearchaeota archaeon]
MRLKIKKLNMSFEIDFDKYKDKKVLLQFPDGIKPYSKDIVKEFEKRDIKNALYLGSNFGACDLPRGYKDFDYVLHFGHNKFIR